MNTPKTDGTGLIPVYWNGTEWKELTNANTKEDWYDYDNQKWANAKTADGSMWVWIPRYAYKIESGLGTTTAGEISIKFLQGTTNNDKDGTAISKTYPTVENNAMTDFFVHPVFTADKANGGWRNELPGFWVAKYEAGYQYGTQGETVGEIKYSSLTYRKGIGQANFLTESIADPSYMPYPVFKANTYSYNIINVADAFALSKEIDSATDMYGLSDIDSHLEKNSEWGAVAYLTQSICGRNATEIAQNRKDMADAIYVRNDASTGIKAGVRSITSYGTKGTPNDTAASTTGNMTGVFDLSGGITERTAAFLKGGTGTNFTGMVTSTTNKSTEYLTLYAGTNNIKGDAVSETAGWYGDCTNYPSTTNPIFVRGLAYNDNTVDEPGIFAYGYTNGGPLKVGFRVCLAF